MVKKHGFVVLSVVLAILLLAGFVHVWLPTTGEAQLRAVSLLHIHRRMVVPLPEGKELLLQEDSLWQTGFFVDPRGVLQTAPLDTLLPDTAQVNRRLYEEHQRLLSRNRYLQLQQAEIGYYKSTHSSKDDGYQEVMSLLEEVDKEQRVTDSLLALFQLAQKSSLAETHLKWEAEAYYYLPGNDSLLCFAAQVEEAEKGICLLTDSCLPEGATFFNTTQLRLPSFYRGIVGYASFWSATPDSLCPERISRTDSIPAMSYGSPVVDRLGHVRGVLSSAGVVPLGGWKVSPRLWWACLKQWFRQWALESRRTDRRLTYGVLSSEGYVGHMCDSLPEGQGAAAGYQGQWHMGKREGEGMYTDSAGVVYRGFWFADTLVQGCRIEGDTLYIGDFNASMQPEGVGVWQSSDAYFQGCFSKGKREGFGISLSSKHIVRAGMWKGDVFQGEHMLYTADRVYGIDISRYQHEIKRRRYNILWRSLRITSLGGNANRRVEGETDYPVSFCYIKATQGVRVRNRYYVRDALSARKTGIAVGAYHFFSPISGTRQARFFLSVAKPRKGDLPPVLDVELTERQIRWMGGAEVMRREMKAWLREVEHKTGTKPIIYASQNFIVKYLQTDDHVLLDYPVWIARYSEFKPYVRLRFWQLSCDGRVRGITGPVDINVWNGTEEQFLQFRKEYAVR